MQVLFSLVANDMYARMSHSSLMAKAEPTDKLYIGEWIDFRGKKDAEIVRASGINAGYLSELRAWDKDGKTPNPSLGILQRIAKALNISPAAFHEQPPYTEPPVKVSRQEMAAFGDIKERAGKAAKTSPRRSNKP